MTIRTIDDELVATCAECGEKHFGGTLGWKEFIADLKAAGWLIKKEDDEWIHLCTDCR